MASVKLTAGSFYTHFRSKEDLLARALDSAFEQSRRDWPDQLKGIRGCSWVREFASFYLSKEHRNAPGHGCPMPALSPEIYRIGGTPRTVFERHLLGLIDTVELQLGPASSNRSRAISAVALCVGGLQLARAVKDPALSDAILGSCREAVVAACTSA